MDQTDARRMLMVVATAINDLPHDGWCRLRLGRTRAAYDLLVAAGGTLGQSDGVSAEGQLRRHRWCSLRLGPVEIEAAEPRWRERKGRTE